MTPLLLVITVCSALTGSPYRDHCDTQVIPIVVDALPAACTAQAISIMARDPERYDAAHSDVSWGCFRRKTKDQNS